MLFAKKRVEVDDEEELFDDPPVKLPTLKSKPTPEPQAVAIADQADVTDEYVNLCEEIGLVSIPAVIARLGLRVYDEDEVRRYLNHKYSGSFGWRWFPLRKQDRTRNLFFHNTETIYRKPVPFAVLKTIKAIQQAAPSATFFVSDEASASDVRDPFLLVTPDGGGTRYIVERWDEPSFR